jgi:hypothetical protein
MRKSLKQKKLQKSRTYKNPLDELMNYLFGKKQKFSKN